jgi:hypothetical protein
MRPDALGLIDVTGIGTCWQCMPGCKHQYAIQARQLAHVPAEGIVGNASLMVVETQHAASLRGEYSWGPSHPRHLRLRPGVEHQHSTSCRSVVVKSGWKQHICELHLPWDRRLIYGPEEQTSPQQIKLQGGFVALFSQLRDRLLDYGRSIVNRTRSLSATFPAKSIART